MSRIETLIAHYDLSPHPEGGWYRETYRSDSILISPVNQQQRHSVTQIYFLLAEGDISRFHKVLHDEIWHFHEGAPLRLLDADTKSCQEVIVGPKTGNYHHVIKGSNYQAAESTGEYTLVSCTVAPGFDFADFSFLSDDIKQSGSTPVWAEKYKSFV